MVASLEKSLAKQVERGKLDEDDRDAVLGRVTATDHIGALADCDLVIESVVEDLDVKKALFAELDGIVQGRTPSSPPTPRPSRSSRWPSRPSAPTRSAASTSSTRRR